MYSLGVLLELEALLGKPLHHVFHAIYGTSTGAIIAASLAYGLSVQSTLEQYRENLPRIMSAWRRTARRDALVASLQSTFGSDRFDAFKTHVALVATNFGSRHPLIFKTNIQAAHGLRSSFVPGFGCTIVDAICASCSAFPFFPKAELVVNQEPVTAIDGGFVANDPSLFAFIDLVHAARIGENRVRILSVGTGAFPERVPLRAKWQLFRYAGGADLMQRQFDIGSSVIQKVAQLTIPPAGRLRVHHEFREPEYATSMFEADPRKLETLRGLGRRSFGKQEAEINSFMSSQPTGTAHEGPTALP